MTQDSWVRGEVTVSREVRLMTALCDAADEFEQKLTAELRCAVDALRSDFTAEIAHLRKALVSIASSTCCDKCQEAALVARAALDSARFRERGADASAAS